MTETLSIPNPFVPLETVEENNLPAVVLGGYLLEPSTSEAGQLFSDKTGSLSVIPSKLDDVQIGEHAVTTIAKPNVAQIVDREGRPYPFMSTSRAIQIDEVDGGRVFSKPDDVYDDNSFTQPDLYGGSETFMTGLGYIVVGGKVVATPTPETVKSRAINMGVDIELFPGACPIPARDFLGVFSRGAYPVSTGSINLYTHDIGNVHLPAMVLGGEPLKVALATAASRALEGTEEEQHKAVEAIDFMTLVLGQVLYNVSAGDYDLKRERSYIGGADDFVKYAVELGIEEDVANSILAEGMSKAKELGQK